MAETNEIIQQTKRNREKKENTTQSFIEKESELWSRADVYCECAVSVQKQHFSIVFRYDTHTHTNSLSLVLLLPDDNVVFLSHRLCVTLTKRQIELYSCDQSNK